MNAARRKELDKAIGLLQEADAKVSEARSIIGSAATEEREYYDNMHKNLQGGDKGSAADQAASTLGDLDGDLDIDFSDFVSKVEEARDAS